MPRRVSRASPPELPPPPSHTTEHGVQVYSQQDIGQVVQYLRLLRGKRQRDTAGQMGVSTTLLHRLESGTQGVRLQSALDALASLGLDIVLVPRDRRLSLQAAPDGPAAHNARHSPGDTHDQ